MDFIDGETLAARVAKGRMSAGEASSVGQEVCRALAAVHRANIIHRDVKAQNVMRAHDGGGIILMDFGAGEFQGDAAGEPRARARRSIWRLNSLRVAEPASDRHLRRRRTAVSPGDRRVSGERRHRCSELRDAHARGDRRRLRDERPDLPDSFIAIVERAIDPDPMRRYATAGDMEAKLSGEPPVASRYRSHRRRAGTSNRPPTPWLRTGVGSAVGGSSGGVYARWCDHVDFLLRGDWLSGQLPDRSLF